MDIRTSLSIIPDPRIERCKKHLLADMLLLGIIAMVCGVESVEDMVFFGETHYPWLKQYLSLSNGIPSADTILRVLGRIDHRKFGECFLSWTRGYVRERAGAGSVIAIDGKTVRGSADGERKGGHLVSAWAEELSLVLGQVQTAEKSNEITAIPQLLAVLDIAGCMGCQAGLVTCSNRPVQGTQIKLFEVAPRFEVVKQGGVKGMSNDPGGKWSDCACRLRLYPFQPDHGREDHHRMPLFSDQPHHYRFLRPAGPGPWGNREQTSVCRL
jgi:predicted transposase YbfD/YdcC